MSAQVCSGSSFTQSWHTFSNSPNCARPSASTCVTQGTDSGSADTQGTVSGSAAEAPWAARLASTSVLQGRRRAHVPLQNRQERAVLPTCLRGCREVLKRAHELASACLLPALAHAQQAPGKAAEASRVALRTAAHRLRPSTPPSRLCSACLELAATPLQGTVLQSMGAPSDTLQHCASSTGPFARSSYHFRHCVCMPSNYVRLYVGQCRPHHRPQKDSAGAAASRAA